MQPFRSWLFGMVASAVVATPVCSWAAEAGGYAPENIEHSLGWLRWQCVISALCPVSDAVFDLVKRAAANDRVAQYLLGLTLLTGDGLPSDRSAGIAWIVHAAELGEPDAARDIAARLRNGESIQVDEAKIAAALQPQVAAGNTEAMRALGPMYIGGRGVKRDVATGFAMLRHAAELGSMRAEADLAQLYLSGAPGIPADRAEAMKWLAASAGHGYVAAMLNLGYMSMSSAPGVPRDIATGFCWLMRAALADQPQAQEKLSSIFADGDKDDRGMIIAADLVQADLWFRIAARSPFHDNPQIRARIEPQMTTEQLTYAKHLADAWHPRTVQELETLAIALPGSPARDCPPMVER